MVGIGGDGLLAAAKLLARLRLRRFDPLVHLDDALQSRGAIRGNAEHIVLRHPDGLHGAGNVHELAVIGGLDAAIVHGNHEAGTLDERFFMYGEDMDLCARARAAGYRTAIVPEARAVHYGNRSGVKRFGRNRDNEVVKGEMRFYAWSRKPGELAVFRAVAAAKFATKSLLCLLAGQRERATASWSVARTCALFRPESIDARRRTWPR